MLNIGEPKPRPKENSSASSGSPLLLVKDFKVMMLTGVTALSQFCMGLGVGSFDSKALWRPSCRFI